MGMGSVFIVCGVGAGDWAWKSPIMMNDVVGNLFRMDVIVSMRDGIYEYLSLCCTSYMFIIVIYAILVCRVVQ